MRIAVAILLMLMTCGKSFAQSDPTLSAMIAIYTNQAEKQLKSQEKAMLLQTTGHIWTKEEYEATTNFQRQFNDYLDSFRSVLTYAAQIYGFYYEVGKLTENMGTLTRQIKASPKNAIAVALTPNRNTIYRNIVITSLDIVNDIRQVCLSDIKMTEKDRVEIVFGIRPKIKTMNQLLQRLTLAVKYTSLSDVWREIDCRAMSYDVDKNKLSTEAFKRWRRNGYNIRPNKNLDFIIKDDLFIKDDILTKDEIFIDTLTNNNLWENGPQYYAPGNL